MSPVGEGADIYLEACTNEFDGNTGACLVNDCTFMYSVAGNKGAVLQVGSSSIDSTVQVNRCLMKNITCGKVSYCMSDSWHERRKLLSLSLPTDQDIH